MPLVGTLPYPVCVTKTPRTTREPQMTTADMMRRIATALTTGDEMTLDKCEQTVRDWLIEDDEREAFFFLIESARESMYV